MLSTGRSAEKQVMRVAGDRWAVEPPTGSSDAGTRVCRHCARPTVCVDTAEYTVERARLVSERGLCVCAAGAGCAEGSGAHRYAPPYPDR